MVAPIRTGNPPPRKPKNYDIERRREGPPAYPLLRLLRWVLAGCAPVTPYNPGFDVLWDGGDAWLDQLLGSRVAARRGGHRPLPATSPKVPPRGSTAIPPKPGYSANLAVNPATVRPPSSPTALVRPVSDALASPLRVPRTRRG